MNATTLDKMHKMRLMGMYRAFKTNLESGKSRNPIPPMKLLPTW